jgi:hypothetical protein
MADDFGCQSKGSDRMKTTWSDQVAITLVIADILLPLWVVCRPHPPAAHDTGARHHLRHLRRASDQSMELPDPGLERQETIAWH